MSDNLNIGEYLEQNHPNLSPGIEGVLGGIVTGLEMLGRGDVLTGTFIDAAIKGLTNNAERPQIDTTSPDTLAVMGWEIAVKFVRGQQLRGEGNSDEVNILNGRKEAPFS